MNENENLLCDDPPSQQWDLSRRDMLQMQLDCNEMALSELLLLAEGAESTRRLVLNAGALALALCLALYLALCMTSHK